MLYLQRRIYMCVCIIYSNAIHYRYIIGVRLAAI